MAHFVVCEAYFLGCELFLQMCFFPVMHFGISPKNGTLHYFEESQDTCRQWIIICHCKFMTENSTDLSTDWKFRMLVHDIDFHASLFFTPVAQWWAILACGETLHRLLFPENLVLLMLDLRKVACPHTVTKGTGTRARFSYRWWADAQSAHQRSCPPGHCVLSRPFLLPALGLIPPWAFPAPQFSHGFLFPSFWALLPLITEGIWRPGWWLTWANNTSWATLFGSGGPWLPGNLLLPQNIT